VKEETMSGKYDDIIGLPHHVSAKRRPMPRADRAAQFSPFAALTGYGDAVEETARTTEARVELDESEKALLDRRFRLLREHLTERPEVTVVRFLPDERKAGGQYVPVTGRVKRLDELERTILFTDGQSVPMDDVMSVRGALFGE